MWPPGLQPSPHSTSGPGWTAVSPLPAGSAVGPVARHSRGRERGLSASLPRATPGSPLRLHELLRGCVYRTSPKRPRGATVYLGFKVSGAAVCRWPTRWLGVPDEPLIMGQGWGREAAQLTVWSGSREAGGATEKRPLSRARPQRVPPPATPTAHSSRPVPSVHSNQEGRIRQVTALTSSHCTSRH